ncbi:hypothetical protein H310_05179 [Aphanomyces invadans]|uniref:HECT-type E3 ubiquitin transferase n=1 Tax=Aphanomyces invadans TaxID=157072 RepID=A0A024UC07_9STRA|nr:hypothetical protein H310_05179 [Aphanomyces invadans]ETW03814.1 hypothetical protein H310_05179 [Aphanomyces invadans]|eukprot:XP_008868043.1 hypothetical protein H310_05179 [Aphanomyces invadans]
MQATSAYLSVIMGAIAALLMLGYGVWRYLSRRGQGDVYRNLDFGTNAMMGSGGDVMLREDLEDSFLEEGKIEWQCVVCAHMNHPDKSICSLCGATEVMPMHPSNATSTMLTGSVLNKSFMLHSFVDGFVDEDGHPCPSSTSSSRQHPHSTSQQLSLPEARQRALIYRRNNMQLTQRQRQAKRRRLWQRAQLPTGEYVWVRTATFVNSHGNRDDTFLVAMAAHDNKPMSSSSSTGVLHSKESLDEMLHRKNAKSFGYIVKQNKETGDLSWSRASLAGRHHLEDIDENLVNEGNGGILDDVDVEGIMALPFTAKKTWFVKRIKQLVVPRVDAVYAIRVRRQFIFEDSVKLLQHSIVTGRTRESLHISFEGEEGLDAGGILREWYLLVCHEVFGATLGLFSTTHAENQSYWINPASELTMGPRHLKYFRFAGHLLGRGIQEGLVLDAHLSLPLLKHILGVPISFSDLEYLDQDLYKSCVYVRDHAGMDALSLTFSMMGSHGEEVDLKPNGRNIDVTDANKLEYLSLVLEYKMLGSIAPQLKELLLGLYEVIPRAMLSVFDYQELEFFMCGVPNISVEDWRKNTIVRFFRSSTSNKQQQSVVEWFWAVVAGFNEVERGRLLQFATGSSRLPVEGFKGLTSSSGQIYPFSIQLVERGQPPAGMCPKAHTCFNRIDLPLYNDLDELENYLSLVIQMEITGFGLE